MYVYLEPKGGFNDILCVIKRARMFCKTHNRILLVNGMKTSYTVNFSEYFSIDDCVLNIDEIKTICKAEYTIYPNELQNKMNDILNNKIHFQYTSGPNYSYKHIKLNLPNENIKENIIIHSACGCGSDIDGYPLFKELKFNNIEICKERYHQLKKPYLCIHIRNTDYKCDYINFFIVNENEIRQFKEIYIATDDKKCIDFYKEKGLNIKNFTTFPEITYHNLHYSNIDPHIKFLDLLSDIFIIGMSHKLMSNSYGNFITLVRSIKNSQFVSNLIQL
jgi:hypothetical protein